jgi:serine/threonine protein kinase
MVPAAPLEDVGDFALDGLLGEGGSAVVYAARHPAYPGELALKVLHPDLALSDKEIDRFLDEARKLAQLDHPAIVRLVASGRLPDGRPFLAMPRLRGRSLGDHLRAEALAPGRALALFDDVARAVAELHATGLLHRDIKPDNVFWIAPEAPDFRERLVLLDLGIARDVESSPGTTTRAGLSRGTPDYMAPERLFGQRASIRTDVYELALLLYFMLARRPPWQEGDAHGRLDPKVDPDVARTVSPDVVRALEDSLALDVNRRPASVGDLLARLGPIASNPATDERPSAASELPPTRVVLTPHPELVAEMRTGPRNSAIGSAPTEIARPSSMPPVDTGPGGLAHPTLRSQAASSEQAVPSEKRSRGLAPIGVGVAIAAVGITAAVVIGSRRSETPSQAQPSATETSASSSTPKSESETTAPAMGASSQLHAAVPSASSANAPSASASASTVRGVPSAASNPAASVAASASSAPSPPSSSGAMPPACAEFVALMCSPTSGARPEECAAWTKNVHDWVAKGPPDIAASNCSAALSASKGGLEARKNWKPPP